MRYQVVHHTRPWRRVDNHLDCRHCPICGATVHGSRGQHAHMDWHTELTAQLDNMPGPADDGPPEPFTQAVDEDQEDTG